MSYLQRPERRKVLYDGIEYDLLDSHALRVVPAPYTKKYKILNRVIDSLYLRAYEPRAASTWLEDSFVEWAELLKNWNQDPPIVKIPGLGYFELWRAKGAYSFRLYNERVAEIQVWNPKAWERKSCAQTGQFYISFRSRFMQFCGISGAMQFVQKLTDAMCGSRPLIGGVEAYQRISRVDMAVDYEQPDIMQWHHTDEYVAKGPRLKKDTWMTPFGDDLENVLNKVLRDTDKILKGKKTVLPRLSPEGDNKGGLNPMHHNSSFSGSQPDMADCIAPVAISAAYAVNYFARWILEQKQQEDYAHLSRAVGSAKQVQTLYFGRFKSPLYAREYNKLLTLPVQDKLWLADLWRENGWSEAPVWRLEFSMTGDSLESFVFRQQHEDSGHIVDLRPPDVFLDNLAGVWAWLTREWLRHCIPGDPKHRERWEPSPRWLVLQNAWLGEHYIQRLPKLPRGNIESLSSIGRSYFLSATAHSAEIQDELPTEAGQDRIDATELRLEQSQAAYLQHLNAHITWSKTDDFINTLLDARKRKKLGLRWLFDEIEQVVFVGQKREIAIRLEEMRSRFQNRLATEIEWTNSDEFVPHLLEKRQRRGVDAYTDSAMSALSRGWQMKRGKGS